MTGPNVPYAHVRNEVSGNATNIVQARDVGDIHFHPAAPSRVVPRQLPRSVADFTGRAAEFDSLNRLLGERDQTSGAVVISAIGGIGGIGKTALACCWAHRVSAEFPEGQLYVDLRGFSKPEQPLKPTDVARRFLLDLGVPKDHLPDEEEALYARYRSEVAGKRLLMVLDNAEGSAQVTPLVPGSGSCFVIVTSREPMDTLSDVQPVILGLLSDQEAEELLRKIVGSRVDADRQATRTLVRYCANLPIALRLAAGYLASWPARSVADLVAELAREDQRVAKLDRADDPQVSLRRTFNTSYLRLSKAERRLFRLIALHPASGRDPDVSAIAALANLDVDRVSKQLHHLERLALITRAGHRYGMHDLLRLHARRLLDTDPHRDRVDALDRLAHAYYGCVNYAFNRQNNENLMVDSDYLRTWEAGPWAGMATHVDAEGPLQWFDRERANLLSLLDSLTGPPPHHIAPKLGCSLFYFLEVTGHFDEWERVEKLASAVAFGPESVALPDRRRIRARSLRNRGRLALVKALEEHEKLRDRGAPPADTADACREAISLLRDSLDLYREAYNEAGFQRRDRAGEATALRELADAYRLQITPASSIAEREAAGQRAITAYQDAREVYAELGNDNGLASLELALGIAYDLVGRFDDAERCFDYSKGYGSKKLHNGRPAHGRLKAYSLRRMADLHHHRGNLDQAHDYYTDASLAFQQDVNDPVSRARTLGTLGNLLTDVGKTAEACDAYTEAYKLLSDRPRNRDEAQILHKWIKMP